MMPSAGHVSGVVVRLDVAVARDDRAHARRRCPAIDVALGVADVDAARRRDAELLGRVQQRRRMRLRVRRRVAADDGAGARAPSPSAFEQRRVKRVALLVTMPQRSARASIASSSAATSANSVVLDAQRRRVVREEGVAQRRVVGVLGRDAHAGAEQAARAVRRVRAQPRERQRRRGRGRRARDSARPRGRARCRRACRRGRTAPRRPAAARGARRRQPAGASGIGGAAERDHVVDAGVRRRAGRPCVNGL